jgi:hypothetical protein
MDIKKLIDISEPIVTIVENEISDHCLAPDEEKEVVCEIIAQLMQAYDVEGLF